MEYITILTLIFLFTLLLEKTFRVRLYKSFKQRIITTLIFFIFGSIWDSYAILHGDWYFTAGKNLGIKIGVMPIEEYLFTLIVPYNVITIYKILDSRFSKTRK